MIQQILFILLGFLSVVFALSVMLSKQVMYAAFSLMACLLSIAGIFVLANAEFLAIAQVVIYAGGVLILIIFGLLLTGRDREYKVVSGTINVFSGVLAVAGFVSLHIWLLGNSSVSDYHGKAASATLEPTRELGMNMLSKHIVSFELLGFLLLAVLIGAVFIASKGVMKQER